jgi:hypothetical protein
VPSPFEALLLALASWRVWHLLAKDDLTEPLRDRFLKNEAVLDFVECPFCLGAWVAGAWVVAFALWPAGIVWAALVFAVAAVPVFVNHMLSSD